VTACGHDLSIRWQKAPHPCGISIKTSWQDDCTTNRWQDNYASLVVDDEPAIRSYIKVLLQGEGFDTPEAAGGKSLCRLSKCLMAVSISSSLTSICRTSNVSKELVDDIFAKPSGFGWTYFDERQRELVRR
jgi:hypothetical protein